MQLRVNVDQRNPMAALEVAGHLAELGLAHKMRMYLAMVTSDAKVCGNIQEMCYDTQDFAAAELEVYREAARRGLPLQKYPSRLAGAYCSADRLHGYVLAPSGLIFKCWHEVTMRPEHAIGSVLDEQEPFQKQNEDYWLKWDALERAAAVRVPCCPCAMAGVPLEAMEKNDPERGSCDQYRFNLEPLVELRYLYRVGSPAGARRGVRRRRHLMPRIGLIGPADRDELVRLGIRLEERGAEPVVLDSREDPALEYGPGHLRACGQDLGRSARLLCGGISASDARTCWTPTACQIPKPARRPWTPRAAIWRCGIPCSNGCRGRARWSTRRARTICTR